MIGDTGRDVTIRCARKFGVSRVVLFGSCLMDEARRLIEQIAHIIRHDYPDTSQEASL